MSNTYLIHVDTGSAQTVTSPQSYSVNGVLNTYPGQPSVNKVNGNPFQCSVILGNRHRRIRSISLKNAQIPIGFYNVRAPYNTMNVNSIVYTVPPGNYSSVNFLATINTTIGNSVGVFAVGLATNSITFTSGSGAVTFTVAPLSLLAFPLGLFPQKKETLKVNESEHRRNPGNPVRDRPSDPDSAL